MSRSLDTFGGIFVVDDWCLVGALGCVEVERLVGANAVVFIEVCGDVLDEVLAVGDFVAVQALVFERLVEAFDDAVGVWRVVPSAGVVQFGAAGDELRELQAFVGGAVVGDEDDGCDLAGCHICAVFEEAVAQQEFGSADRCLDRHDGVAASAARGDLGSEHGLGGVVRDRCNPPRTARGDLDAGEVGLPDPVATCRRGDERLLTFRGPGTSLGLITRRLQQSTAFQCPVDARLRDVNAVGAQHRPDFAMPPC